MSYAFLKQSSVGKKPIDPDNKRQRMRIVREGGNVKVVEKVVNIGK
jgi:hypothetical protein